MKKENIGILKGVIGYSLCMMLVILTYLFLEELIKYSGITTFYSLLIIIILFIMKENIESKKERFEDLNLLRSILRVTEQIQGNLKYYSETFNKNHIPVHSMSSFDVNLPPEINGKDTKSLDDSIFFANDKIDTLNERRDDLMKIIIDPSLDDNKRKKAMQNYLSSARTIVDDTIKDLDICLNNIKNKLKRWEIFH